MNRIVALLKETKGFFRWASSLPTCVVSSVGGGRSMEITSPKVEVMRCSMLSVDIMSHLLEIWVGEVWQQ